MRNWKKKMYLLKIGAGLYLAGQTLVLFRKDPVFKAKRTASKGISKRKTLATTLYQLNKQTLRDFHNFDYSQYFAEVKQQIAKEYEQLNTQVQSFVDEAATTTKENVESMMQSVEARIINLREKLEENHITDGSSWETKIDTLQQSFDEAKNKLAEKLAKSR